MSLILALLKQIKIVSITELHAGDDSESMRSQDDSVSGPLHLRSIYEHFKTLSKSKQTSKDTHIVRNQSGILTLKALPLVYEH